jgi:hypothetical protein
MRMNANHARASHPRTDRLRPPTTGEAPLITETGPTTEQERCPKQIPGTDIRCTRHTHPPESACTASGSRDGIRFNAVFWREDQR